MDKGTKSNALDDPANRNNAAASNGPISKASPIECASYPTNRPLDQFLLTTACCIESEVAIMVGGLLKFLCIL